MGYEEEIKKLIDNGFTLFKPFDLMPDNNILVFDKEDEMKPFVSPNGYGIAKLIDGVYNIYHIDYIYRHNMI